MRVEDCMWDAELGRDAEGEVAIVHVPEGQKVDVTDPCYDADTWCRMQVELPAGDYTAFIVRKDCGSWGTRVQSSGICLKKYIDHCSLLNFHQVGPVGVDAGMMGYFVNKPDYSDDEWSKFCDELGAADWPDECVKDGGYITSSGYGDGVYPVYLMKVDGVTVGVMVVFIEEDEEEDE